MNNTSTKCVSLVTDINNTWTTHQQSVPSLSLTSTAHEQHINKVHHPCDWHQEQHILICETSTVVLVTDTDISMNRVRHHCKGPFSFKTLSFIISTSLITSNGLTEQNPHSLFLKQLKFAWPNFQSNHHPPPIFFSFVKMKPLSLTKNFNLGANLTI